MYEQFQVEVLSKPYGAWPSSCTTGCACFINGMLVLQLLVPTKESIFIRFPAPTARMDGTNISFLSLSFPEQCPTHRQSARGKKKRFSLLQVPIYPPIHRFLRAALSQKPVKFQSKRPKYDMAYAGPFRRRPILHFFRGPPGRRDILPSACEYYLYVPL